MTKLEKILTNALDELSDPDVPNYIAVYRGKSAKIVAGSFGFKTRGIQRIMVSGNTIVRAITYKQNGRMKTYGAGLLDKFKIK